MSKVTRSPHVVVQVGDGDAYARGRLDSSIRDLPVSTTGWRDVESSGGPDGRGDQAHPATQRSERTTWRRAA